MSDATCVFYELLCWLVLPGERQLALLPSQPPPREQALSPRDNNVLIWMYRAILEYYQFWFDECAGRDAWSGKLIELMYEMGRMAAENPPGPFCLESLRQGAEWEQARLLAMKTLDECGMAPLELSEKFKISEWIEIYDIVDERQD